MSKLPLHPLLKVFSKEGQGEVEFFYSLILQRQPRHFNLPCFFFHNLCRNHTFY